MKLRRWYLTTFKRISAKIRRILISDTCTSHRQFVITYRASSLFDLCLLTTDYFFEKNPTVLPSVSEKKPKNPNPSTGDFAMSTLPPAASTRSSSLQSSE